MWEQLKNIIQSSSDKAIVIEDGKPKFVVLTIEEYEKMQKKAQTTPEQSYESANFEIDQSAKQEADDLLNPEQGNEYL